MKQEPASRSWKRIDDPKAAKVIADPVSRRFLEPFLGTERMASQVASELGVATSSVLYRLNRFSELDLVQVTRTQARAGRPIRFYRSTADCFFVPFAVTSLDTADMLSAHVFQPWQELLVSSVGEAWLKAIGESRHMGFRLGRDIAGRIQRDIVPESENLETSEFFEALLGPSAPAVWDTWGTLTLLREDAKSLQEEIAVLQRRYRERQDPKGTEHIVRLALAPTKQT